MNNPSMPEILVREPVPADQEAIAEANAWAIADLRMVYRPNQKALNNLSGISPSLTAHVATKRIRWGDSSIPDRRRPPLSDSSLGPSGPKTWAVARALAAARQLRRLVNSILLVRIERLGATMAAAAHRPIQKSGVL